MYSYYFWVEKINFVFNDSLYVSVFVQKLIKITVTPFVSATSMSIYNIESACSTPT